MSGMDWNVMAEDMERWKLLVKAVMKLPFKLNVENFLNGWKMVSFSR
jgi:hypothetical protein